MEKIDYTKEKNINKSISHKTHLSFELSIAKKIYNQLSIRNNQHNNSQIKIKIFILISHYFPIDHELNNDQGDYKKKNR